MCLRKGRESWDERALTSRSNIEETPGLLQRIEDLRYQAAIKMGLITSDQGTARTIPNVGLVSSPVSHRLLSGETQEAKDVDIIIRVISDRQHRQPHRAIPLTATICSAAAAKIKGTVVEQCPRETTIRSDSILIGHVGLGGCKNSEAFADCTQPFSKPGTEYQH